MSASVSGFRARLGRWWPRRAKSSTAGWFNASGSAGPRRPVIILLALVAIVGLAVAIAAAGRRQPILSRDAPLKPVNPLPGGLYGTPQEDALAFQNNAAKADAALRAGKSYTPRWAASDLVRPAPPAVAAPPSPPSEPRHDPVFASRRPASNPLPEPLRPVVKVAAVQPVEAPAPVKATPVAATVDPKAEENYRGQIDKLFSRWGARPPRTEMVLPPGEQGADDPGDAPARDRAERGRAPGRGQDRAQGAEQGRGRGSAQGTVAGGARGVAGGSGAARDAAAPLPVSTGVADAGHLLVPAGRGVFAHPVLATNSDASSPVVLQADSGPIAGDRMIGSFSRQDERLVLHISTVVHNGESIGVDGVVIAPETMEVGVASNVDHRYLERFALPAAAAFVAGLGQAIATTSNTNGVLSPFGGASYSTHLNIGQQLGVAGGAAAAQIGSTLAQSTPKGPTVSLDANVSLGVMFLSPCRRTRQPLSGSRP